MMNLFLSLLSIYCILSVSQSFSVHDIDELRIAAINKFDTFGNDDDGKELKPLIGSIIRLVFHDCAGPYNSGNSESTLDNMVRICDGCIDLDKPDHAGLRQFAIEPIESICQQFVTKLNRADCWSAVGTIALEYAASLSSIEGTLPIIPYYIGRYECELSPDGITSPGIAGTEFPLAHLGWDPLFDFFQIYFDFNVEESTVIMGAHTLGRAHHTASGFNGKWTTDSFAFNHRFFVNLLDTSNQWDQTQTQISGYPQWSNIGRNQNEHELMMLNADMSVIAAFEDNGDIDEQTGIVSCRWEEFTMHSAPICPRERSFDISAIYARDNQRFLDDFALVWIKLITNNQNGLTQVIPNPFRDMRNNIDPTSSPITKHPTTPPILISREPTNTPISPGQSNFCCIADRIPNWNGRCWGAFTENDCISIPPQGRCHWDINNCRPFQTCLLRGISCTDNSECCSLRCRTDNNQCR